MTGAGIPEEAVTAQGEVDTTNFTSGAPQGEVRSLPRGAFHLWSSGIAGPDMQVPLTSGGGRKPCPGVGEGKKVALESSGSQKTTPKLPEARS